MSWLIYGIVACVLFVFVLSFVFKVFMKVLKIVLMIGLLLVMLGVVLGFLAYQDAKEFDQKFSDSLNLYLFEGNSGFSFGFEAPGFGIAESTPLSAQELADAYQNFVTGKLDELLGDRYKLFIFREDFVNQLGDATKYEDLIEEQGPALLFSEYKTGNIIIFPETPLFKAVKLIPESIASKLSMLSPSE